MSLGVKVWAKLAGWLPVHVRGGAGSLPVVVRRDGRAHAGRGTVVVGFGPSAATLSPDDPEPVARAIEELLPGARVEEVGGHDWVRDPLAGETWASYGPGRSLRWLPELERPEGRVAFAGGDFARGWGLLHGRGDRDRPPRQAARSRRSSRESRTRNAPPHGRRQSLAGDHLPRLPVRARDGAPLHARRDDGGRRSRRPRACAERHPGDVHVPRGERPSAPPTPTPSRSTTCGSST